MGPDCFNEAAACQDSAQGSGRIRPELEALPSDACAEAGKP